MRRYDGVFCALAASEREDRLVEALKDALGVDRETVVVRCRVVSLRDVARKLI